MGWYQRLSAGNFDTENYLRQCRWCGDANETVSHVYSNCTDLQILALSDDFHTKNGQLFNAEYLVNDPISALYFHDQTIGALRRAEVVYSQLLVDTVDSRLLEYSCQLVKIYEISY